MSAPIAADFLPFFLFGHSANCISAPIFGLDFLRLLVKDHVRASLLGFETRRLQLAPWGEDFSVNAAASGFALVRSSPLRLECVSCGSQVDIERTDDLTSGWTAPHHLGCQLDRLRALYTSPKPDTNSRRRTSLQTRRLKAHLRTELASTKATVAREFSFDDDTICMVMARHFLNCGRGFKDAGSLVDSLTDLTLRDQSELAPVIAGTADMVKQLTPPPLPMPTPPPVTMTTVNGRAPPTDQDQRPEPVHQEPQFGRTAVPPQRNLRRETQALLLRKKCKVCREKDLQFLALPCSHFVFCETCHLSSKQCPVCKTEVHSVIRTYTS